MRAQLALDECRHEDGKERIGKGVHAVHEAHEHAIRHAADIGRERADHDPDGHRDQGGGDGDDQRDPGPHGDPRHHVAAELIGAQPMLQRRHFVAVQDVLAIGIIGQKRREDGERDHQQKQEQAEGERRACAGAADNPGQAGTEGAAGSESARAVESAHPTRTRGSSRK